jgi:dihydropteroate synthase
MGVLNITPDSFSDGGLFLATDDALRQAGKLVRDGVDIIDIGGESSRPAGPYGDGAEQVTIEEETRRTAPVIEAVVKRFDVPISIDTVKAAVARSAIDAGAVAVNDISGLRGDTDMLDVITSSGASVFIMHSKGTPQTMQRAPMYDNLIGEIRGFLANAAEDARAKGVPADRIAIDPGLGFGKSYADNYEIIRRLPEIVDLGYPILVGPSRKTFVGVDFSLPPDQREEGSLAAFALCACAGAAIIRVHDVKAARRALFVADGVRKHVFR